MPWRRVQVGGGWGGLGPEKQETRRAVHTQQPQGAGASPQGLICCSLGSYRPLPAGPGSSQPGDTGMAGRRHSPGARA